MMILEAIGVLLLVLLVLALSVRLTLFSGLQVRRMRWRARCRLSPGPGFASHAEITKGWSRTAAAVSHGSRSRPDMGLFLRLFSPATDYAVRLGRGPVFRRVYGRGEDQMAVVAPPRTGKTGFLADRIYSHPGAAVVVSTRSDLYDLTAGKRAQGVKRGFFGRRGPSRPILVINPEGWGGIPSSYRPDIISECVNADTALKTAAALIGPGEDLGEMKVWLDKASHGLAAYLHACALYGGDMDMVLNWANRINEHQVRNAVNVPRASPQLLSHAIELEGDGRTAASVRSFLSGALAWISVPDLKAMVSGPGLDLFDAAEWVRDGGTIFAMNSGDQGTAAPLFRAIIEKLYRDLTLIASKQPRGRFPVPVLFALDELTQTCSVPLDKWISTAAGFGVQISFVIHNTAQLVARYGDAVARVIFGNSGCKVILGGNSDAQLAKDIEELTGHYGDERSERVVPPAFLRQLPEGRALVIAMNRFPIIVKTRPQWHRLSFRLRRYGLMRELPLPWTYYQIPEPVVEEITMPEHLIPEEAPELEPTMKAA